MPLPLVPGDVPEDVTVNQGVWTKAFSAVKNATITRNFLRDNTLWITYVNVGAAAPVGLLVPKWQVLDTVNFSDGLTARDVYLYPVEGNFSVFVEA